MLFKTIQQKLCKTTNIGSRRGLSPPKKRPPPLPLHFYLTPYWFGIINSPLEVIP